MSEDRQPGTTPSIFDRTHATRRNLLKLGAATFATGMVATHLPDLASSTPVAASADQIEPKAGTWKPWLLTSGDQFRLPPPPDAAATAAEIEQLKSMSAQRDTKALDRVAYWEAGAAPHRWNDIFIRYANVTNFLPNQLQARALTYL